MDIKKNNILFIGGVFAKDKRDEIVRKSKGSIQFAADTLQWNFINGLEANIKGEIDIINAVFVGSFPKHYSDLHIKGRTWTHNKKSEDIDIGFINIFGIKHIARAFALKRKINKWCKKNNGEKNMVIYSMHLPFIYAASKMKSKYKDLSITLIVPDLPEYMDLNEKRNSIICFLKCIDKYLMNKYIKYIDNFVLLTEQMREKIGIDGKMYVVIEGMCNPDEVDTINQIDNILESDKKIILYTGTLQKQYGIMELVGAFSLIKDKCYRLWICGDGDAKEEVIKASQKDYRIKYYGQVDRQKALQLQGECTVLVNPRSAKGEYTKYSFPSKTMEYLLSGKPVIMKRLPGAPEEYTKYIFTVESDSVEELSKKIIEVCELDYNKRHEIGMQGKKFVINEKNYLKQTEKLIKLINN